ncbi:hypothetical protein PM033_17145 [Halorubrum ezzemoulense]|uniref:hypothetical protein n=1 Tax=Halorubrum ezzemoulense TaxID=337243 RepID=UPI00232F0464|nr:hypothetical protein [Halorubrum ezzemoulense]MDB2253451.1 hypothetical protein [Halorubrum ezzemoulense]
MTIANEMDDIHTAVLVDGETGVLVITSRHDSQGAWTQKEADWKVRQVGTIVIVEDAEVALNRNDEWGDIDTTAETESWANLVLNERARGSAEYPDELTLDGRSSLTLYEPDGSTRVHTTISLGHN